MSEYKAMSEEQMKIGSIVEHEAFGKGMIVDESQGHFKIYFHNLDKSKHVEKQDDSLILEDMGDGQLFSMAEIEDMIWRTMLRYGGVSEVVAIAEKWKGGSVEIKPGDSSQQSKEIPIDTFFHKIVMVRDRLRVLEQQINSSKSLEESDKIHLQQYITRAYGSLTTFNVLFKLKADHFKGSGS